MICKSTLLTDSSFWSQSLTRACPHDTVPRTERYLRDTDFEYLTTKKAAMNWQDAGSERKDV